MGLLADIFCISTRPYYGPETVRRHDGPYAYTKDGSGIMESHIPAKIFASAIDDLAEKWGESLAKDKIIAAKDVEIAGLKAQLRQIVGGLGTA